MCRKMTLCGVVFFLLSTSISSNGQSRFLNLRQPDGTRFQAREVGQCWLTWFETPEGYMVQRGGDGYYHYVTIDNEGEFVKLPVKAGIDRTDSVPVRPYRNPAIRAKLEQRIEAYNQASEENRARFLQKQRAALGRGGKNATLLSTSSYNVDIGILLVEFTDLQHYTGGGDGYTVEDFENMLFSDDYYHTGQNDVESPDNEQVFGSMRDYFEYQSHGILQITGSVINPSDVNGIPTWLNMQVSVNSYPVYANVAPHYTLYRDAINAAIDSSWNVDYDMHIIVIAGSEQDGPYITGTGFHRGFFSESQFDPSFDFDNWFGAAGYHERNSAEWRDSEEATFTHIGIFAHEAFHVMGWGIPNIFDEGSTIYLHSGSGDWSSMNLGYRTGPLRKTESPGDLDPIARILMEWAVPTDVTTNLDDESITYIEEDANLNETFDFYRLTSSYSVEEFIVENRQYSGLNSYLPEWWESGTKGGLLVWRHASSSSQTRAIRNADNDTEVVLEGMPNVSDGDLGDPFPGASNNTEITPYTTQAPTPTSRELLPVLL